ncbi:response regulator [Paenibacillus wynnii]|uniref:response regulator n=1 Tax=Paenibacillus wynnii TaxID=268407 RepID=UPI00278DF72F|nr:response regulator [Paenibacillus wynnii]MDQ0192846.1 two-component system chemotaxis response regulator CheY [Paenibacillus wynnii]
MKKVLIVDDSAFVRMSLQVLLRKNGFQVVGEAEDGNMAIKKYVECQPDIVTMDITMPECSGIDALRKIMKFDPNAKVVMISSMGQEKMVREAMIAGAKSFLLKPYNEERVVKTLQQIAEMVVFV